MNLVSFPVHRLLALDIGEGSCLILILMETKKKKTDAAKHLIKVKTVDFGGSPRFKEDGTEYVPGPNDGEAHEAYVGTPRREIDHNWALLHWGRSLTAMNQSSFGSLADWFVARVEKAGSSS